MRTEHDQADIRACLRYVPIASHPQRHTHQDFLRSHQGCKYSLPEVTDTLAGAISAHRAFLQPFLQAELLPCHNEWEVTWRLQAKDSLRVDCFQYPATPKT